MPNCIQLTRKGSSTPSTFHDIDRAICQSLSLPFDEVNWACGWYDYIAFLLAIGKTFEAITDELQKQIAKGGDWAVDMLRINHFLMEHYDANAWYETKR